MILYYSELRRLKCRFDKRFSYHFDDKGYCITLTTDSFVILGSVATPGSPRFWMRSVILFGRLPE